MKYTFKDIHIGQFIKVTFNNEIRGGIVHMKKISPETIYYALKEDESGSTSFFTNVKDVIAVYIKEKNPEYFL